MNKTILYIAIFFSTICIMNNTYASNENKNMWGEWMWRQHSEHPPHDHHDSDHLKYLTHHPKRKRKAL